MSAGSPKVFVSHNSKDKSRATALVHALRAYDIELWIDHEQIKPGDSILTKISDGLSRSDFLLFLISKNSVNSPWCRPEYEAVLTQEFQTGEKVVIPIKLDDSELPILLASKRRVTLTTTIDKASVHELAETILEGIRPLKRRIPLRKPKRFHIPKQVAEGVLLLLLLDRYQEGAWGRSLAPTAGDFGHAGDPGSISVSTWATDMLARVFRTTNLPEIDNFREYLLARRKSTGAVGMRKIVGHRRAFKCEIRENCRHTAVAAKFLKDYAGPLDLALGSLRYVIDRKTPTGAWSAGGDVSDQFADPLTTAYVLRVLKDFEKDGLLQRIGIDNRKEFIATYWKSGMHWMYRHLIRNGYWWLFKTDSEPISQECQKRSYSTTADICLALPEFPDVDNEYAGAHARIMQTMMEIWGKNGVGIPTGPGVQQPDLGTTAMYTRAVWFCRELYPEICSSALRRFVDNLEAILEHGCSDAVGWSVALMLVTDYMAAIHPDFESLERARRLASLTWETHQSAGLAEAIDVLPMDPVWVRQIAQQHILPVVLTPP